MVSGHAYLVVVVVVVVVVLVMIIRCICFPDDLVMVVLAITSRSPAALNAWRNARSENGASKKRKRDSIGNVSTS